MSIETLSPLPLTTFGTWVTLLDPSDVPPGMSPSLADVEFFPGGVRTRPGLVSSFTIPGGLPSINGLKTYASQYLQAIDRSESFSSAGGGEESVFVGHSRGRTGAWRVIVVGGHAQLRVLWDSFTLHDPYLGVMGSSSIDYDADGQNGYIVTL